MLAMHGEGEIVPFSNQNQPIGLVKDALGGMVGYSAGVDNWEKENMNPVILTLAMTALSISAVGETFDRESYDVRTLAAYLDSQVILVDRDAGESSVSFRDCLVTERRPNHSHGRHYADSVTLDCTATLERKLGLPATGRFSVYTHFTPNGNELAAEAPIAKVDVVKIYVAAKKVALRDSAGLGFYQNGGYLKLTEKSDLRSLGVIGDVYGEEVEILQFAAFVRQSHNAGSLSFKPFMSFEANGNTYRVWEKLDHRHGHANVASNPFGTHEYSLRFHGEDRFQFYDILANNELVRVPVKTAALGQLDVNYADVHLVSISHLTEHEDFRLVLRPRWSGESLYARYNDRRVFSGKPVWIRVQSQQELNGLMLTYSINAGEVRQASQYLGGDCFGHNMKCFEINVPQDAVGRLNYWLSDRVGDFSTPIVPSTEIELRVGEGEARLKAGESVRLRIDPRIAVRHMMSQGNIPDSFAYSAIVRERQKDGSWTSATLPMGTVVNAGNNGRLFNYRANSALMDHLVGESTDLVTIQIRVQPRRNGVPQAEIYLQPFSYPVD